MLLSLTHRFLFIHIPKTGGISVRKAFEPHATQPADYLLVRLLSKLGVEFNHWGPLEMRRFRTHTSARQSRRLLPRSIHNELYRFAFVRNPWDRIVSYYHYVLTRPDHRRHEHVKSLPSFEHYVDYELQRGKLSQADLLIDERGKLLVDFVGHYETLEIDFEYLREKLGVSCSLGHYNRSNHRDYRSYYRPKSIDLVAEHLRDDIALFGYTFDGLQQSCSMRRAS